MNTAQVIPFEFESREIRTCVIDDQPWFAVQDILHSLAYAKNYKPARATAHVPEQWKGVHRLHTLKGIQKLLMLSEQGLYFFLGRSDKSKALSFQMWLAGEVLPAIRKHGRYEDHNNQLGTLIGQTIGTDGFHMLGAVIHGKVGYLPAKARQRVSRHLWAQVHKAFSVTRGEDIPASQIDAVRNFIGSYALEGEWIAAKPEEKGNVLTDHQLYQVWLLMQHFSAIYRIFKQYKMYDSLTALGSRAGIEMIDRFVDGDSAVQQLHRLDNQFDAVQQRNRLNQYA